jgi:hypothetical protein
MKTGHRRIGIHIFIDSLGVSLIVAASPTKRATDMALYGQAYYNSGARYNEVAPSPKQRKAHMRNLHYYMQIPFGAPSHSTAELSGFTADHLNRMSDNNTGGFLTARIAATTTAFSTFAQGSLDDQTQVAIRGALVKAKENFRRDLPVDIQKVYGQCLGHYSEAGVEMKQIFPEGRSVFGKCRDNELAGKLGVMVAGVTAKQADLGAPLVTQATAIVTNWNAIYAASLGALSDQGTTQEAKKAARENLCLQLYLNLLAIAAQFPGDEEKLYETTFAREPGAK